MPIASTQILIVDWVKGGVNPSYDHKRWLLQVFMPGLWAQQVIILPVNFIRFVQQLEEPCGGYHPKVV